MNYLESSSSTQVSHNDEIVGFHEEAETIRDHLLMGDKKLDVISIVGMAGVGKTTLALHLYNTPSMADHYDILACCSVSQTYRRRDLLLSILDQVDYGPEIRTLSNMDDQDLADHLSRSLRKRRYLIVLDDIWDIKFWEDFRRYLPDDGNGSRILITTRNRNVADQIQSNVTELHELSTASSWILFRKKMHQLKSLPRKIPQKESFPHKEGFHQKGSLPPNESLPYQQESLPDQLNQIAQEIVYSCKGLPLSIVIIAGILSDIKRTKKKWKKIAASVSFRVLSNRQGNCEAILELSYKHLKYHLRNCFLYLASFPEGQQISVKRLIIRWIGEGLVQDTNSESAEEVAKMYIKDLIVKSLVIPVKERLGGGIKTLRLHDLLRDFCLSKAKNENFFTMLDNRNDSPRPLQDPTRLILNRSWIDGLSFSRQKIQSLISYFDIEASKIESGKKSSDMVRLKVLEVGKMSSKLFPEISSLVHLRYLAFGLLKLNKSTLPSSSISKLENLEILILKSDREITVPDFIFDMMKLRHVHISEEATFEVESDRLENSTTLLDNIRSLSKARVSWVESKWESKYLRKLSGLQSLSCVFVEYDSDAGSDEEDVIKKDHSEEHLSRMLRFNDDLTSLKIRNDADKDQRFVDTCQLPLPISLVELTLSKFYLTQEDLSLIGRTVTNLEVFKIFDCKVDDEWNVDDDEFTKLKVLKLRRSEILKWTTSEDAFPNLEQLWVEKCNRLMELPREFGDLLNLCLITIRKCEPSLDNSAREIERTQHEQQNAEMRVLIYPRRY